MIMFYTKKFYFIENNNVLYKKVVLLKIIMFLYPPIFFLLAGGGSGLSCHFDWSMSESNPKNALIKKSLYLRHIFSRVEISTKANFKNFAGKYLGIIC